MRFSRGHFKKQYGFATLYAIAIFQRCFFDSLTVDEGPVGRAEVAQERVGRVNLQQTMVPREKTIVRQTKMGVVGSSDQKRIVLTESEDAALVRTCQNFEIDLHYDSGPSQLPFDLQIVKGHIYRVAGIQTGEPTFVILSVRYVSQILAVDIKLKVGALDSYFKLVGT